MTKNKTTRNILIFVGILLLAGVIFSFTVFQTQFVAPAGWSPLGSSGSAITGLQEHVAIIDLQVGKPIDPSNYGGYDNCAKIKDAFLTPYLPLANPSLSEPRAFAFDFMITKASEAGLNSKSNLNGGCNDGVGGVRTISTSAFWKYERSSDDVGNFPSITGDDFHIQIGSQGCSDIGNAKCVIMESQEAFGRGADFRTELKGNVDVYLKTTQTINIPEPTTTSIFTLEEITSSPITDTVNINVAGQTVDTKTIAQPYKIVLQSPSHVSSGPFEIKNSAFKNPFGCKVEPDEQFYFFIFTEGSTVSKSALENFHSWCLDTSPAEIWTNIGKTIDTQVLLDLEGTEGRSPQTFTVAPGQLWGIEYIGEKKTLITPCEQDELLVNGNNCMTSADLEFQFICAGGQLDVTTGECISEEDVTVNDTTGFIITTTDVVYEDTSIQTHKFLENLGMFRFTSIQYNDPDKFSTPSSFTLFGETFTSDVISDSSASFTYGNVVQTVSVGQVVQIDEVLSVKLTRAEYDLSSSNEISSLAEWTFSFDIGFLELNYDIATRELIFINTYKTALGGFSLIKEDNTHTFTTEEIPASFPLTEGRLSVGDISKLLEIKAIPWMQITTPDYNYQKIVLADAITIRNLEEDQIIVNIANKPITTPIKLENIQGGDDATTSKPKIQISTGLIAGIIGGLIVGGLIYLIIRGLSKKKISSRRRR